MISRLFCFNDVRYAFTTPVNTELCLIQKHDDGRLSLLGAQYRHIRQAAAATMRHASDVLPNPRNSSPHSRKLLEPQSRDRTLFHTDASRRACRRASVLHLLLLGGRQQAVVLQDDVRGLLADHDAGRVGVAARQRGHDGGVGAAQAVDSPHAQPGVDDGGRLLAVAVDLLVPAEKNENIRNYHTNGFFCESVQLCRNILRIEGLEIFSGKFSGFMKSFPHFRQFFNFFLKFSS